eukprot:EG_transcript_3848
MTCAAVPQDTPLPVKRAVLFALLGFAGDVILSEPTGFRLHEEYTVHPSERHLIDTLVQCGYRLTVIEAFIQQHGSCLRPAPSDAQETPSFYLVRVCEGMAELLGTYRRAVAKMDWELENNPVLPVVYFQVQLTDFLDVLAEVADLCGAVTRQQLRGAGLLNELHRRTQCGIPIVREVMLRLLRYAYDLMLQHLTFWVLYGVLPNSNGEFFIVRRALPGAAPGGPSDIDDLDAAADHQSVFEEYQLDSTLVPAVLAEATEYRKLPEKILFIGKATRILHVAERRLEQDRAGEGAEDRPPPATEAKSPFLTTADKQWIQEELEQLSAEELELHRLQVTVHAIHQRVGRRLWTLLSEETHLKEHLRALRDYFLCCRGDFFAHLLELTAGMLLVDLQQSEVLHQLQQHWRTACVMSSADDDAYFERFTIRWEVESGASFADGQTAPEATRPRAVSGPGGAANDGPAQRTAFTRKQAFAAWRGLTLDYAMQWPLPLLIPPNVVKLYNRLFQFLTVVLRIQKGLHRLCKKLMLYTRMLAMRVTDRNWKPKLPLWKKKLDAIVFLRQRMAHFIDNVAYYLQVDVLETQYNQLMTRISQAEDFEEASRAHERYISGLISACFLDHHMICSSLEELFVYCVTLVNFAQEQLPWPAPEAASLSLPRTAATSAPQELEADSVSQVTAALRLDQLDMSPVLGLETDFERRFKFFFTVLSAKKQQVVLSGLLLRLDYNGYVSQRDLPSF